jgi:hypothetical protein
MIRYKEGKGHAGYHRLGWGSVVVFEMVNTQSESTVAGGCSGQQWVAIISDKRF